MMRINFGLYIVLMLLVSTTCINRIDFETGSQNNRVLVVDGYISDNSGPYIVKLFYASNIADILNFSDPVVANEVVLFDDLGNSEILKATGNGIYSTDSLGMRGIVGRRYGLRINLKDGRTFQSEMDELSAPGKIDSLYWEYETHKPLNGPTESGFRVFVDAKTNQNSLEYTRWKFEGTYRVETNPELHVICPCDPETGDGFPDPRECSGFSFFSYPGGSYFKKVGDCGCCICWVSQLENKPHVKDNSLVENGVFKREEIGYVPINEWTFYSNKYLIEVEQMNISKNTYEFWKTIQNQKEGASNIFQPSFGKPKTNITELNGNSEALGWFYATSIIRKQLWITAADVPFPIPRPKLIVRESCLVVFPNSTTQKPDDWE